MSDTRSNVLWLLGFLVLWTLPVYAQGQGEANDCLSCHGDRDLPPETERGKGLNLYVDEGHLAGSVHGELACTDCHGGAKSFEDVPHNEGKPLSLQCRDCHEKEVDQYRQSIHGLWHERGDEQSADCADCHGTHDILPSSDPGSKTYKFKLHETCARCHQNKNVLETHDIANRQAVEQFIDSIHGRALLVDGLIVAPSCNDCHGVHDILPHAHPQSKIGKDLVPKTCGKCHVLVEDIYNQSIHGQLLKKHDRRGPVCTTCHTSHKIQESASSVFRLQSDRMCGQCHEDRLRGYRDTFHGKAIALGREEVAACYDCHGHHDIQKADHPASHIGEGQRLKTCQKCHPKATANFAGFIVHADHTDKERYPLLYYVFLFMTSIILGTFAFFAVHSLLWLLRSLALYRRDSKDFRDVKLQMRNDPEQYVRFRPIDRFLHALIIVSFLLLVLTGMPLKFFYTDWGKWLLHSMGGQEVAAILHRFGAMITLFYFAVHISEVLYRFVAGRARFKDPQTGKYRIRRMFAIIFGPDSPVPTFQDLKDVVNHNKWFFGKGAKPQFDRWTYWEKFDYLAVFWGVGFIGLSGLIMWFPEFFTLFLPGWIINVALIIHSDEALLAAGFIFTFHFFNVHFRPEKFPMDSVMFSGRISKSELLHERRRWYDRMEKSGDLENHRVKDEWDTKKYIALPAGFLAFCIGVILIILIYHAMITRLLE